MRRMGRDSKTPPRVVMCKGYIGNQAAVLSRTLA